MLTPDITRCLDKKCPQKLTCSRWMERDDPRARGRIDTMRDPGECRCRRCKAWLSAEQYQVVHRYPTASPFAPPADP